MLYNSVICSTTCHLVQDIMGNWGSVITSSASSNSGTIILKSLKLYNSIWNEDIKASVVVLPLQKPHSKLERMRAAKPLQSEPFKKKKKKHS